MPQPPKTLNTFEALLQIISDLRGPEGCPWDKEQTHNSLARYAIEEVHEMVEAIESADDNHICEELGDVLFQVVLHTQLAKERKAFNISDVIESITTKIVRRHPHVFSDTKVKDAQEVITNWQAIKQQEKKNKPATGPLDIPTGMPSLQRAQSIGEKTEKYRFDWDNAEQVLKQLQSEIAELQEAIANPVSPSYKKNIQHELGDVLFSAAQLARHLEVDSEAALREANRRFTRRFAHMVASKNSLEEFTNSTPEEKESLWKQAKKSEVL